MAHIIGSNTFASVDSHVIFVVLVLLAGLGGLTLFLFPRDRWWCMTIWIGLFAAGYSVLSVPFYSWYAFPLFYGVVLLAALGHVYMVKCIRLKITVEWLRKTVCTTYIGLLVLMFLTGAVCLANSIKGLPSDIQTVYTMTGHWLKDNTPLQSSVGFFEIGYVGYYSDRRMIDPVGLSHGDIPKHVAKGDFTWAFRKYKPDYIILTPVRWYDRIGYIEQKGWFKEYYLLMKEVYLDGYYDSPLRIYQRGVFEQDPSSD